MVDIGCSIGEVDRRCTRGELDKWAAQKNVSLEAVGVHSQIISEGDITVDSGAAESVWQAGYMKEIPTQEADKSKENIWYVAANGSRMRNMGMKQVKFKDRENDGAGQMDFQVTDVQKPLTRGVESRGVPLASRWVTSSLARVFIVGVLGSVR